VRRRLLPSPSFLRAARRVVKKDPPLARDLQAALALLEEDAFDSRLRTHKLKGKLEGSWACSAGYDLRILFSFVTHEGEEAILLETVGNHDEVY
jgi:mRNA-degrading endonuclease YafQ of YafQ-DinJ toxin-antitoxin module